MRPLLAVISAFFFAAVIVSSAASSIFTLPWEGGRISGPSWTGFISLVPIAYAAYCFVCAMATLTPRGMLVSGIVAHAFLAAYLVTRIVQRVSHPGWGDPTGSILLSFVFGTLWFARYRAVCRLPKRTPPPAHPEPPYDY
jgi:hypothetical protein